MTIIIMDYKNLRNIAIIAHVDHGKTTLVDFLLKQSHTFRENEAEMQQTTILDANPLERERGITILAKNTAINYRDYRINIIDTPGHADFSGEVERTLGMADGAILLIDAQEGPMPQTKFVLKKALDLNLKVIVVINKIDKPLADIPVTLTKTHDLFLDLASHEDQLEFPVIYAIGREGKAGRTVEEAKNASDLTILMDEIINYMPPPQFEEGSFQMLVSALSYDEHKGKHAIGKIKRGEIKKGDAAILISEKGVTNSRAANIFISQGLHKTEVESAGIGEIIELTGFNDVSIGDTLSDPSVKEPLPRIQIDEPTIKIILGPNTSPFSGKEGKYTTSRQIADRLKKEIETNVALKYEQNGEKFTLFGRGELHLSILLETLRREGYEFEIGKPEVVLKHENGQTLEPVEEVTIDVPDEFMGVITTEMGVRKTDMLHMLSEKGITRFVYKAPSKNIFGIRNIMLTATKGTVIISSVFMDFEPMKPAIDKIRNGVLIASESGPALAYGLENAQERGITFVEPGENVYEGMIIGFNSRRDDIEINVAKGKKLTNMRASNSDISTILVPPLKMSLEQYLDFIEADELLEITPKSLRPRKRYLSKIDRVRAQRGN